jgi:REP element-mobilizing transposase RayT
MARPLRIQFPGAVYHITVRGNAGQDVFLDANDHSDFLDVLATAVDRHNWLCHGYCVMPNHYHLLLETVDPTLARGMHHLNGVLAQRHNRRHARKGHLYQGRYKAILVEKEAHLLELTRYVTLNPVRAELVSRSRDWTWSSYRATAGLSPVPPFLEVDWVLSQFGRSRRAARRAYRRFVARGLGVDVWRELRGQIYLGGRSFVEKHAPIQEQPIPEIPRVQHLVNRPALGELFESRPAHGALLLAHRRYGYTFREIGAFLGIHPATASRRLRRYEMECAADRSLDLSPSEGGQDCAIARPAPGRAFDCKT